TNHLIAATTAIVEAPATALLYWHLGVVAAGAGVMGIARALKAGAIVTPMLMLAPLVFFVLHRATLTRRAEAVPTWVPWASSLYMAVALVVAFLAAGAMVAVVARLVVRREEPGPVTEHAEQALCRERNVDRPVPGA
ncbi:MAG TPA: hypothetical protein VK986_16105, partial [Tepidisphaeraceae bacterium]|nr:hypothetical protein [Tepidisphaeraceae bacterium]